MSKYFIYFSFGGIISSLYDYVSILADADLFTSFYIYFFISLFMHICVCSSKPLGVVQSLYSNSKLPLSRAHLLLY